MTAPAPVATVMMSLPRLPLPLPSPRQCPRSIPRQDWTFWLPPRRRKTLRTSLTTITLNNRGACLTRAILISRPRFPRQRRMPTLHPRSRRLAPALPTSLRVRLQRAEIVDDFEEKRAAAREAAEQEAIAQQQAAEAARELAAQEFEQNEAMQSAPVEAAEATTSFESQQPRPRMLLKRRRLSRLSSTSIAPCRLMPRSSIPR